MEAAADLQAQTYFRAPALGIDGETALCHECCALKMSEDGLLMQPPYQLIMDSGARAPFRLGGGSSPAAPSPA